MIHKGRKKQKDARFSTASVIPLRRVGSKCISEPDYLRSLHFLFIASVIPFVQLHPFCLSFRLCISLQALPFFDFVDSSSLTSRDCKEGGARMEMHLHIRGEKEGSWTYGGEGERDGRWETGAGWRTGWFIMVLALWAVLTDFHNQDFLTLLSHILACLCGCCSRQCASAISLGLWGPEMAWRY